MITLDSVPRYPISIHFDRAIMNDSDKIRISEEKSNKLFQMFQRHENIANMTEDVDFIMQCAFDKKKSVWEYCSEHLYVLALISPNIRKYILDLMDKGSFHQKFIIVCSTTFRPLSLISDMEYDKEAYIVLLKEIVKSAIACKSIKIKSMGIQRAMQLQFNSLSAMIKSELTNNESLLKSHGWIYHIMTKGYSLEQSENGIWIHFHGGGLRLNVNMDDVDNIDKYVQQNYADRIQLQFIPHNGMEHLKHLF